MAVFSTNQNRHLYVANAYAATIDDSAKVGTVGAVKVNDGELSFTYKGVDGAMSSDRINLKNVSFKAIKAADMKTPLKSYKVTLSADIVAGQDYVLGINFHQWGGAGEIYQYYKDAVVHAESGMKAQTFYEKMAASLNACFSREIGATKTTNPYLTFTASADGLTITEKEQDWELGTFSQKGLIFDVIPSTIFKDNADVVWGEVTPVAGTKIGNGKKIADLEYFCMGERGDIYRNAGWPNVVTTKYLVDPTKEYNVLEIHHAFTDEGVNSYRSEKDITIVASDATVLDGIIGAINEKAETTIDKVGVGE